MALIPERFESFRQGTSQNARLAEPDHQWSSSAHTARAANGFVPLQPVSLVDAGLGEGHVEALILKYLLNVGTATGLQIADAICLPFAVIDEHLRRLKAEQTVFYKSGATLHDYVYELSELGHERALRCLQKCSYCGPAPVSLADYAAGVRAQSIDNSEVSLERVRHAFDELLLNEDLLSRVGQAVHSGRGLFLHGPAGNGKTSIAERLTKVLGDNIWIPHSMIVAGEIIQVFDPGVHEAVPTEEDLSLLDELRIDERWIRIRRPTVVVAGELTLDNLELARGSSVGVSEASLQLKSNCGTLVIDDFGRQRFRPEELMNRWIMPLEKKFDLLTLPSGIKVKVPFDQLIVFATNLEPSDLVEEAFLRRVPYKIEMKDPTSAEFIRLFQLAARQRGFQCSEEAGQYLIETHYRQANREMRFCHPRDLLEQMVHRCSLLGLPRVVTHETIDTAVQNYFGLVAARSTLL